ncbi:GNAT family N-acetyltransferase [Streptomyces vilmorinianum]|uniref:GNAT family N-acetyltransferase n=1 Tax=Streptomyces vilmorinianum TaxID=3051092 RepID=UPI0010FB088D|nr:GNAT family N-acetyltransferase [Streptomyces vilmorinianum]
MNAIPPVVRAGGMCRTEQPAFTLDSGCVLRPWEQQDVDVLVGSCHDPDIQMWNRPGLLSLDQARARIVRWGERWLSEQAAIWAIAPVAGARPVGLIGLGDLDLAAGDAELLYWLLPEGRGRGLMVEATVRISRWALDDLGLHRLRITHSVANPASCRVATAAGFLLEGTMRSALLHADGWHDEHLHARVQGDQ